MRNSVSHGKVWVYSLEDIIGERKLIVATTFLDRAGTPPAAVRGLHRFSVAATILTSLPPTPTPSPNG